MTTTKNIFSVCKISSIALMLLTIMSPATNAFVMNPSMDYFPAAAAADNDNVTAAHFMRMSMDPATGTRLLDPNGMLMQHHNAGFNPSNEPASTYTAGSSITENSGVIDVTVPNWTNMTEPGMRMQVQVLSFRDPILPGVGGADNLASNIDITSPGGVTEGATQTFADVLDRGNMWDALVQDFTFDSAPDTESITIDTNGANIGQVYVFTTTVPIPAAVWLFGSGVLGLFATAKKRSAPQAVQQF
jgi:hypothetical protein